MYFLRLNGFFYFNKIREREVKRMKKLTILLLSVFLMGSVFVGRSEAVPINDFTMTFSKFYASLPDLHLVDESAIFHGYSYVKIDPSQGTDPNNIDPGDLFDDYVVWRVTDFADELANKITPANYGAGVTDTHELTFMSKLTGKHTAQVGDYFEYIFEPFNDGDTSGNFIEMYLDGEGGFTQSNYSNLATFKDGKLVEKGDIQTTGKGVNWGDYNFGNDPPSGEINMNWVRALYGDQVDANGNPIPFELDKDGNDLLELYPDLVFLDFDTNNDQENNLVVLAMLEIAFENYFFGGADAIDLSSTDANGRPLEFFVKSDGSMNKEVIPEPATMLLLGSGLIGLAGFGRKKKFFKKN